MTAVLSEMISLLVAGVTGIATGIGEGLTALIKQIFVTGAGTTESPYALSVFGSVILIFAGIGLAIGLSRLVVHWLTTLGASNM